MGATPRGGAPESFTEHHCQLVVYMVNRAGGTSRRVFSIRRVASGQVTKRHTSGVPLFAGALVGFPHPRALFSIGSEMFIADWSKRSRICS